MASAGRCSIRLTRRYAAAPEEVWEALTEPESVRRWLDPHGDIEMRVRRAEAPRLLELDWDVDGDLSAVRFELVSEGDRTVLVVEHEQIDERIGMAYMRLWTEALARFDQEVGS